MFTDRRKGYKTKKILIKTADVQEDVGSFFVIITRQISWILLDLADYKLFLLN
jgi:hypothetical protein